MRNALDTRLEDEAAVLCRRHFGQMPDAFSYPGGRQRKTCLIKVQSEVFAISHRSREGRARLEAEVLAILGPRGLSPRLVVQDGRWVIQSHVSGERLSQLLDRKPADANAQLGAALDGLAECQSILAASPAARHFPLIGNRAGWTRDLASQPQRLAASLGLPEPAIDVEALAALLVPCAPCPVKWDARPGNVLVHEDRPVWIDWEHCGLRNSWDDVAWLLADEWSPDAPCAWSHPLATAGGTALPVIAVLHGCVRLYLIYRRRGRGRWWSHDDCLKYDRVGVTSAHVKRVARRSAQLCREIPLLGPAETMLTRIEAEVESLSFIEPR